MPDPSLARSHALPLPPTPLIGREQELTEVCGRLRGAEARLLTLTGAPGTGKTRLALAAAAALDGDFADGVRFVPLDAVRDPERVAAAIAQAAAVQEAGSRPLLETLADALAERALLLVLDNFEHVLSAAPVVAALLTACPRLTVLVTSRASLRLRWEQEVPVEPLALPPPVGNRGVEPASGAQHPGREAPEQLLDYAAVRLFVTRARAARPEFRLTADNAGTVAEICRRLDGLPLAIELAAARVRLLSPAAILGRLERRLELLTQGARDVPSRHQTLRAAIGWSYDLLTPAEQTLFRRLGAFLGGCTLEAAEVVAGEGVHDVLDGVASLVDQSLLVRAEGSDGEPRVRMLETIREFALEQLAATDEWDTASARHTEFFLFLAEEAAESSAGPGQRRWLDRLAAERDNLRLALERSLNGDKAGIGARLAAALGWFWRGRGYWAEAAGWLERALAQREGAPPHVQVRLLWEAAEVAIALGDFERGRIWCEQSLALAQELYDQRGIARGLFSLGNLADFQEGVETARQHHEESLTVARVAQDQWAVVQSLGKLAIHAKIQGDLEQAQAYGEEGLAIAQATGDTAGAAGLFFWLGMLAIARREPETARSHIQASLALYRELDDDGGLATSLNALGEIARWQGDYARAQMLYEECLAHIRQSGDQRFGWLTVATNLGFVRLYVGDLSGAVSLFADCASRSYERGRWLYTALALTGLAGVVGARGGGRQAVRFFAAVAAMLASHGGALGDTDQKEYDRHLAAARARLDDEAFAAAWAGGEALSAQDALAEAIAEATEATVVPIAHGGSVDRAVRPGPGLHSPPCPDGLTPREVEVLGLLAAGLSNREIAEALVVSVRTVERHIDNIYGKIGVHERRLARQYARAHGILAPTPTTGA